ncbi:MULTISPECIES: nucleotide pyrophosphohydrolase [Crateriforma]|uniref:MazG nucleotide pyrophosphohydrolase domain protein n=1 Tax=Crateriforma conspicua TaxID=2527996 RepID=A0A5C6FTV4_9PLAN|nr:MULTISPECIES: nucleotide pyrophosphohydrolase [Crateriforma]TWU65776.1 MazG nucleotide pyrophosphohydrolase domain protein [Crateriforma conspicua]
MSDETTTIAELKQVVDRFVSEREWHAFHNPKNLAMSLSIEAAELMEHFQWLTQDEADAVIGQPENRHEIGEEIADCLAYLLSLANVMNLDLDQTLRRKMVKNAAKYPVETSRGVARPNPSGETSV